MRAINDSPPTPSLSFSTMNNASECQEMNDFLWENLHDLTTRPFVMVIFGCLYSCVIVAGLFGNSCVVLAVARTKQLHTVPYMFIVSLSCSDIIVCLISATITPITALSKNWIFGSHLCTYAPLLSGISLCFSTFTLTAVAIDRFILIAFPTRQPIQPRQAALIIVAICLLAFCMSTPMMLKQKILKDARFCGEFCTEDWGEDKTGRRIYGTVMVGLQFVLPLLIIIFCYTAISVRLGQSLLLRRQNANAPMTEQRKTASQRRQRTNRMLIGMVVAFVVSWSPNISFNVLRDYEILPQWAKSQEMLCGIGTHWLAMTSTLWNPLLYSWLNLQLRAAFFDLMPPWLWKWKQRSETTAEVSPGRFNCSDRDAADVGQWRKRLKMIQKESQRQQFSDCIRAATGKYGALDECDIVDDRSYELPTATVAAATRYRRGTNGSIRYFVSRLSIVGSDGHRFINAVVPHRPLSGRGSTADGRRLPNARTDARRLLDSTECTTDFSSCEKSTVCRTSSI